VKLVRDSFTNEKYNIESILCRRAINSKNPQLKTKEVIIKNY
jgi:DNA adenine methylase